MTGFSSHLVARAVNHNDRQAFVQSAFGDDVRMPTWGLVLLVVTALLFAAKLQVVRAPN